MSKTLSDIETHLSTIAKNAGLGIVGQIFFIVVGFGTTLLITRTIGPEQYGIYALAITIYSFVEISALMGLQPAMVKFVSQYKAQGNVELIRGTIVFGLVSSLLASFILIIGLFSSAELLADRVFHETYLAPVLRIVLLGLPFSAVTLILFAALQGAKQVKHSVLVQQILMPVCRFISISAAFWFGYRLLGVAWCWMITSIFGFIMAIIFLTKKIGHIFTKPIVMEKKKIMSFSFPLLFNRFFYKNINLFGVLIIGILLSSYQVGIYSVALRALPFFLIPFASYEVIFPPIISELFSKGKMDDLEKIYKKGSIWLVSLTLPLFVLIVFFSEQIVSVFGPGFAESAQIMSILLVGQLISACAGSPGFILVMTGKVIYETVNSVLLCIINIILTLFLISKYGLIGVAWAYSFSTAAVRLIQLVEVWYIHKITPFSIEYLKPIISTILSFIIMYFLCGSFIGKDGLGSIFVLISIFSTAYISLCLLFGLSDEDKTVLMHLGQKLHLIKKA